MTSEADGGRKGHYARAWDEYVERLFPNLQRRGGDAYRWPGDEWGTPDTWTEHFERLFETAGVGGWRRAVEIGQGSGKYTEMVLSRSPATVRAYDVSERFLDVCRTRCAPFLQEGRLSLHLLDDRSPGQMYRDLASAGWERKCDAVFSIDAMVHVDLQYLMAYVLTAGLVLQPGGKLALTLADPTTPQGFRKLMEDIRKEFPRQSGPSYKFEWVSRDMIRFLLGELGFSPTTCESGHRDMLLVAELVDPARPELFRDCLVENPPGA